MSKKKRNIASKAFDLFTNPDASDEGWDKGYEAGLNGEDRDHRSIIRSGKATVKALIHGGSTQESFDRAYDEGYFQGQRDRMHQTTPQLVTTAETTDGRDSDEETEYLGTNGRQANHIQQPINSTIMTLEQLIDQLDKFSKFQDDLVHILQDQKVQLNKHTDIIVKGAGNFLPYYQEELEQVVPDLIESIRKIQKLIYERTKPATRRTIEKLETLTRG